MQTRNLPINFEALYLQQKEQAQQKQQAGNAAKAN
jgi:preprotein translocase subunit SecB